MRTLLALSALTTLIGCSKDGAVGDTGDTAPVVDLQAEAEAAFAGYQDWGQVDTWQGVQVSESPHGGYTQIWWNDVALATYEAQNGAPMPAGTTIVKESYNEPEGETVVNLTVMYKPDTEYGWYWGTWTTDGEVITAGQEDYCIGCHVAGQDYVMVITW